MTTRIGELIPWTLRCCQARPFNEGKGAVSPLVGSSCVSVGIRQVISMATEGASCYPDHHA
jgi:hypothetical protein